MPHLQYSPYLPLAILAILTTVPNSTYLTIVPHSTYLTIVPHSTYLLTIVAHSTYPFTAYLLTQLELIAAHSTDRAASLKMAAAKKGLANEYKRSLGKSVMMRKLKLEQACNQWPSAAISGNQWHDAHIEFRAGV